MSLEFNFRVINQHRGRHPEFLERYELAAGDALAAGRDAFERFSADLISYVSDERNLMTALDHLRVYGGGAPGMDGECLVDIDGMGQWSLVRHLRDRLRDDGYERGPLRRCHVPKHPGSAEKRTIWIPNLDARVVARGTAQILVPSLEPAIDTMAYSWRRRGTQAALAYAMRQICDEDRTVLIAEDLRNAFDHVPRERLEDILRRQVPNTKFCRLTIDSAAGPSRRGILQGSALSSPLLDLYLSHFLHRPWRMKESHPPLLSYVDDLLLVCRARDDALRHHRVLEQCVRAAGMRLKHGPKIAIRDLTKESVTWLGYRLRLVRGELRIRSNFFAPTGPDRRRRKHETLVRRFAALYDRPGGWRNPNLVIRGIVAHLAPALPYEDPQRVYETIAQAAAEAGFQEILGINEMLTYWTAAHGRWLTKLRGSSKLPSRPVV